MAIDRAMFESFSRCQYKAFLKGTGAVGIVTEYERLQAEADDTFKNEAIERLMRQNGTEHVACQPTSLAQAVAERRGLILCATAEALGVTITFEAIERHGAGQGAFVYVPVLFFHRERLAKEDSLLATVHGIVLTEALGQSCPFVKVVHGPRFASSRIKLNSPGRPTRLATEARRIIDRLGGQIESGSAPPMVLNSHCPSCEFRDRCRAEAIEKDDLSLLRGMSEKEILAQRRHGITTVTQFAYTFRPKSVGMRRNKAPKRHLHALQALAIRDKKVYVVRTPEIPAEAARVYLDVEGMPDRDSYYLVGLIVEKDGRCSAHSFWADDDEGERAIWFDILHVLRDLGDYTLFHYGSYEKTYIAKMLRRHPSPNAPLSDGWSKASINVLAAIRTNVYFPAYSNGLKDVAAFLGAIWGGRIASGIDCIAGRLRWEKSKDSTLKEEIIAYNLLDCVALQRVVLFLSSLGSTLTTTIPGVVPASEIAASPMRHYGKIEFAIPEMDMINKCARFDYQREKVFLRTDPCVRASVRRGRDRSKAVWKANAEVRCGPPARCPECGSTRIRSSRGYSKLVNDLKFTRGGVKRWILRYVSDRNLCLDCSKTFYSDAYPTHLKAGHGLSSWAVYQHVALRQSFNDIALSVNDIFGYEYSNKFGERAHAHLAEIHRTTRDKLLAQLRRGHLIHADETKISIKGGRGYVWAFSGTETVVYLFSQTREGTILMETITGFSGVLVSDFYAVYDSVMCPQQKCHLHLMRDINNDLLQHPFDEDLKEVAQRYTLVLKPIVDTVDKHGLRSKYLVKHRQSVRGFLDWVSGRGFLSEVAQGYKTRIEKYGDRLFTFLDHDGVPWNNNCAENAVKLVAARRRIFGTSLSEAGLNDYLVLLSIYQTLRRKRLSLLRFLLSGETDLETYVAAHR